MSAGPTKLQAWHTTTTTLCPSARRIDFPSVSGFAMAALGAWGAPRRGERSGLDGVRWLRCGTSPSITVWLTLAGLLSAWAFQRGEGWWPLLAAAGVLLSVVAVVVLAVLAVVWLLINFPSFVTGKRGRGGKQRKRW